MHMDLMLDSCLTQPDCHALAEQHQVLGMVLRKGQENGHKTLILSPTNKRKTHKRTSQQREKRGTLYGGLSEVSRVAHVHVFVGRWP